MRPLLALLLATTALPALAETIPATSTITAVTVYPSGAKITRQVSFAAPSEGAHELLITDLPAATEAGLMQITASDGITHGAFSLRADRLPPRADPLTPAQEAAQAEVDRLEAAERDALAAKVERVRALHGPCVVQVLGPVCSAEECDHEDACPLVDYTVCGHCYDVGDGAHPYAYEDGGLQDVAHPCATYRALDATPETGSES